MAEISLPIFQGPLDLLLHLIEKDDLDITAVSLVAVTDQYLAAIHTGEGFDPSALAEFVAIGARLIYLKSRALLPRPQGEEAPSLEDDDVGQELVELLREYRRFLQVVDLLEARQDAGLRISEITLDKELAEHLNLPEGTPAVQVVRTKMAGKHPVAYMVDVVPVKYVTLEEMQAGFRGSVLDFLL
ncbi:MAG: segregation/condensation protein A, partial [Tepidiforma sp.]